MDIEKKRQKEIEIVSLMIHLYCRYHDDIDEQELIGYAAGHIIEEAVLKGIYEKVPF